MNYLPSQTLSGPIFAIAALALAAPSTLLARHYSRSLYFAQMLYLFSSVYNTTTSSSFSQNLNYSWLSFMPQFTSTYCTSGDFSCKYGSLISPALCWLGGAVLLLIIIKFVACKKREAKYLSFYNFYKGLFYWFMGPLVFYSVLQIVTSIQNLTLNKDFIAAAIVVGVFVGISLIQLISYKIAQREEQNSWRKWIQFLTHYVVGGVMVCVVLSIQVNSVVKYIINVPLAIFSLVYLLQYKFNMKIVERIFMVIQDAIIIATYNIFVNNYSYITTYDLDFYALGIVIVIEILQLLVKLAVFWREGGQDERAVSPLKDDREKRINNTFISAQVLNPEGSYDGLPNNSGSNSPHSPRQKGGRRK